MSSSSLTKRLEQIVRRVYRHVPRMIVISVPTALSYAEGEMEATATVSDETQAKVAAIEEEVGVTDADQLVYVSRYYFRSPTNGHEEPVTVPEPGVCVI